MALIWRMTLAGSVAIAWVLLARLVLRRGPKVFSYALWAVVLLRLLCPVAIQAPVSLVGSAAQTGTGPTDLLLPESEQEAQVPQTTGAPTAKALPLLWGAGAAAMAGWSLVRLFRLKRKLAEAVPLRENIFLTDWVNSPFVLGLVRPKIYLPAALEEREYIILHERQHIRRGDHVWKVLGYGALCVHWFNPLVWLAFVLGCRDMEMSCDEEVLKALGPEIRSDYGQSLLWLATGRKTISGAPLAFGEGDTKMRIKNVLRWQRPKWWSKCLCGLVCIVVLAGCGVDPVEDNIVRYERDGIKMELELPKENWQYEFVENVYGAEGGACHGIAFWAEGHDVPGEKLYMLYWPGGFMASNRFTKTDYTLENGANVRVGVLYEKNIWEYIYFLDEERSYVLMSPNTPAWWDEYSEVAIDIINSIRIG